MPPPAPGPRADLPDILRGFALLGICIANAAVLSLYIFQPPAAQAALPTAVTDTWARFFHFTFIDGKFYSLFSLLFGLGFAIIFFERNGASGRGLRYFYRRLAVLAAFGIAHTLLLWDGDILLFYAVLGAFLPLFRRCSDRTLLLTAALLLLSPLLFDAVKVLTEGRWNLSGWALERAKAQDAAAGITEANVGQWALEHDRYGDLLTWNRSGFWWSLQLRLDSNRAPKVLALFLLGLWAGRNRIYAEPKAHTALFRRVLRFGLLLGLPAGAAHAWAEGDGRSLPAAAGLLDTLTYALNTAPLALAYAAAFALWYARRPEAPLLRLLRPVGRMALTNYIAQSAFGVALYYGIGAGLGGKVGPSVFLPVAVAFFCLQVAWSHLWFRYFDFGPLEWVWRQLTYGRRLPLRRVALG
ncbi:DUF418 domain-containing protein [Flaviaesturariibacter amylovorans]|uniref:DUF418 domain-containing protein n=1 Tax=Flaviaesturariibacter amylovorans TaxID=1084520 RepID=A0ABP8HU88_9BACT